MQPRLKSIALILFLSASLFLISTGCKDNETPVHAPPEEAAAQAPEPPGCAERVPVTADNFNRAESDMYFTTTMKGGGGLGKFDRHREVMDIDHQTVIRANRDTLYSAAVFDLEGRTRHRHAS